MNRSATDVMHDVIFSATIDAIMALRDASRGMPNALARDLNAIHANATFADLPKELQAAITASVRGAFTRLLREGYTVSDAKAAPPPRRPSPTDSDRRPRGPGSPPRHRGPRPDGGKRPQGPGGGGGGRGPRKPAR